MPVFFAVKGYTPTQIYLRSAEMFHLLLEKFAMFIYYSYGNVRRIFEKFKNEQVVIKGNISIYKPFRTKTSVRHYSISI